MKTTIGLCLVCMLPLGCEKNGATQVDTLADEPVAKTDQVDTETDEPVVKTDRELAAIPSMPMSQLLGKSRADIETLFRPSRPGHATSWVRYNDTMEVRYENDLCVEMILAVRGGLGCKEAAAWAGFGAAMAPIYKSKSCVWPPASLKHSLGEGVSGELVLEGGLLTARLDR